MTKQGWCWSAKASDATADHPLQGQVIELPFGDGLPCSVASPGHLCVWLNPWYLSDTDHAASAVKYPWRGSNTQKQSKAQTVSELTGLLSIDIMA